ncbi:matrix metalloproteinase-21-like [Ambystoma mexicanum]|uniref:matrix metalloproteinase-21-like n=1 Tax=Ambystoma mexicanum TaxID=8296 RepID=UPI0037E7DE41
MSVHRVYNLGLLVGSLLLLPSTYSERPYHSRDHSDLQQARDDEMTSIQTQKFAQRYLRKYGWIEPVKWESLRYQKLTVPAAEDNAPAAISVRLTEGQSLPGHLPDTQSPDPTLNPSFITALKRFQEANGLAITGTLDEATQRTMHTPRCGVPDHKVPEATEEPGILEPSGIKSNESVATNTSNRDDHYSQANISNLETPMQGNITARPMVTNDPRDGIGISTAGPFLQRLVSHVRKKRSSALRVGMQRVGFAKLTVKWRLLGEGYSVQLPLDEQRNILKLAFRIWSEVVPLDFEEDLRSPAHVIDIKLGFGTRRHLGCSQVFDGTGQEFAHAWQLGDIHFDDDEHFVLPDSEQGISLLKVAVHEIGHVLGLSHMNQIGSVMQPNYIPANSKMELSWVDRNAIQKIYGKCEGRFNTVFDWVWREKKANGELGDYHFNTYFFRNSWYWMYENRSNRTRYGDPIQLAVGWHGIPHSDIDAFVHIWTWDKDYTLFFKGTQYWRYDSVNDKAYTEDPQGNRYPRPITEGFPGVFSPIDTAYYDRRDRTIYFFRENNVTAFNVETNNVVPGYPKLIKDVFPAVILGDHPSGNLDATYFSFTHQDIFFMKDRYVWRMVSDKDRHENPALPYNGLFPGRPINEQWYDICDVHPSMLSMARR